MEVVIAKASVLKITGTLVLLLLSAAGLRAGDFPLKRVKPFTYVVDYEPFWSPDGRQIVLISSRHGGMKVHVMDANSSSHGSDMRRLTSGEAEDDSPAWSPDGKKIAFVSIRAGVSQICVMNADGNDVRQLTNGNAENIHPMWSPDSEKILFNTTHFSGATAADGRWQAHHFFAAGGRTVSAFRDESRWRQRTPSHGCNRRIHESQMVAGRNKNPLQPTPGRHKPDRISSAEMKFRSDKTLARAEKVATFRGG